MSSPPPKHDHDPKATKIINLHKTRTTHNRNQPTSSFSHHDVCPSCNEAKNQKTGVVDIVDLYHNRATTCSPARPRLSPYSHRQPPSHCYQSSTHVSSREIHTLPTPPDYGTDPWIRNTVWAEKLEQDNMGNKLRPEWYVTKKSSLVFFIKTEISHKYDIVLNWHHTMGCLCGGRIRNRDLLLTTRNEGFKRHPKYAVLFNGPVL